jgi:4-aminobutyrate---pyruvate transaminase
MDNLKSLMDHPIVGDVRGVGLMAAVEMVPNKKSRAGFAAAGKAGAFGYATALQNGVVPRVVMDQFIFCPPLIITEEQALELVARTKKTLDTVYDHVKREGIA